MHYAWNIRTNKNYLRAAVPNCCAAATLNGLAVAALKGREGRLKAEARSRDRGRPRDEVAGRPPTAKVDPKRFVGLCFTPSTPAADRLS